MRYTIGLLCIVCGLTLVAPGFAAGPLNFALSGGMSLPAAPSTFSDYNQIGYQMQARVGRGLTPLLNVDARIGLHSFKKDWSPLTRTDVAISGGDLKVWTIGIDARFSRGLRLESGQAYGFGGLGIAGISESDIATPAGFDFELRGIDRYGDQTKLYLSLGGGLAFPIGAGPKLFVEFGYFRVNATPTAITMIPVSVGVMF